MGQLTLSGQILGGPPQGSENLFPASSLSVPLALRSTPKVYGAAIGVITASLNQPVGFATLHGPGAAEQVTKGDTLYVRASSPISVRLTTDDGAGGNVVATIPVFGTLILEFPPDKFLKLLEASGSATVEYFVSGPQ